MGQETRRASLGSLWSARCAQLEPGLGIADLHGVEPSAHNGDDRKLPNWPHLEIVHVKAGNQAHAAEDRTAAGYRRTRTITPQGGELAPSERSKPVALLPMSEQMKRSCSCRLKPPQPIFRDRDGPNSRAICGSGSVAELLSGRQSTAPWPDVIRARVCLGRTSNSRFTMPPRASTAYPRRPGSRSRNDRDGEPKPL